MIVETTSLRVPESVLCREIDGEAILLNTETGLYFGLDSVGSAIWTGLCEHGSIAAAMPSLLDRFDTDEETLRRDLVEFVGQLVEHELLEPRRGP